MFYEGILGSIIRDRNTLYPLKNPTPLGVGVSVLYSRNIRKLTYLCRWKAVCGESRSYGLNEGKSQKHKKRQAYLFILDAIELFKEHHWQNAFVYLDPPYFGKGKQVYVTYFTKDDHEKLRNGITEIIDQEYQWLLSYDDCREIHDLYAGYATSETCFRYSITKPVKAKELIIEKDTD